MLLDPYRTLLDEAQLEAAHDRRSAVATERQRATENASLAGLLLDAAESQIPILALLSNPSGSSRRVGVVRHVSDELVVLRTASSNFHAIRRNAIVSLSLSKRAHPGGVPTSERAVEQVSVQELLFLAAELRLEANLQVGGDRWIRGVVLACGQDVCTVRGDAEAEALPSFETINSSGFSLRTFVTIEAVQEVVLADA